MEYTRLKVKPVIIFDDLPILITGLISHCDEATNAKVKRYQFSFCVLRN